MAIKLGIIGTGTVGCGCIEIIQKHAQAYKRHFGVEIELAALSSRRPDQSLALGLEHLYTPDYHDVVNNPEIDIVVELIGGVTHAKEIITQSLKAGKSVVTANKALMASCGGELLHLATQMGQELLFEASVGGGIPIINPLKHSLIANEITSVMGIVNGTTNYMLSRMSEDGLSYPEALKEAQEKGFAEADPSADVDGLDAAAKIAILASIAFNSRVSLDEVPAEGIRHISPLDLAMADSMGYCVKLLAHAHKTPAGIDVRVHPTMLKKEHPLASVNGVFNAIYTEGDAVGESMFFGQGAGAGPAASAVMGDVLEVARHKQAGIVPLAGCTCTDDLHRVSMCDLRTNYYIRFSVEDRSGVLAQTAEVFSRHNVSIYSMIQKGVDENGQADLVYVTHTAREADVRAALADIARLEHVLIPGSETSIIRVEQ